MSLVEVDTADGVRTLTLNRPEARNALSFAMLRALADALSDAERDPEVAVVVLTGTDPAFCAGLDLEELGSGGGPLGAAATAAPWPALSKLMIGAVNGVAVTGGLELALHCDFLVASERAMFGDTHARVGIMPGWGMSVLLPQRIGLPRAIEMSMTGNFMGVAEALAVGLVNHVVPHEELMAVTGHLARDVVSADPAAVASLLGSYRRIAEVGATASGLRLEAETARQWRHRSFDPAEVDRRRQAIVERGRRQ